MLQSYINAWVEELERVVSAFEAAVDEVEEAMDTAEQASVSDAPDGQVQRDLDLRQLDNALESAQQVAALVKAVNAALDDAIDAAQHVVANERVGSPAGSCEASTPGDRLRAPTRGVPTIHGTLDAVGVPNPASSQEPLPDGTIIIQGKYRVARLLHRRPRLHLYLAERINKQPRYGITQQPQPLVAIRELVLTGLSPEMSKQIERAAFEEFVAPGLFGSPHLPGAGDRMRVEGERHYTVMQLRPVRGNQPAIAVSLADLLLQQPQWPAWLDIKTVWEWGIQLCRVIARLRRVGVTIGDLHPATILVDPQSAAEWAPVLLVSWPPPLQFWPASSYSDKPAQELPTPIFPIAIDSTRDAFAAPETFNGEYDERSDVYSLGAILYLLLTRYAPVATSQRLHDEQIKVTSGKQEQRGLSAGGERFGSKGKELIPPHLFNKHIPLALEQVVVHALSLDAANRYSSVAALLEALESINLGRNPVQASG